MPIKCVVKNKTNKQKMNNNTLKQSCTLTTNSQKKKKIIKKTLKQVNKKMHLCQ